MNFENTCFDLTDCTDKLVDEGIESKTELKHARKLAAACQAYLDAFEQVEEELDEEELNKMDDEEEGDLDFEEDEE